MACREITVHKCLFLSYISPTPTTDYTGYAYSTSASLHARVCEEARMPFHRFFVCCFPSYPLVCRRASPEMCNMCEHANWKFVFLRLKHGSTLDTHTEHVSTPTRIRMRNKFACPKVSVCRRQSWCGNELYNIHFLARTPHRKVFYAVLCSLTPHAVRMK